MSDHNERTSQAHACSFNQRQNQLASLQQNGLCRDAALAKFPCRSAKAARRKPHPVRRQVKAEQALVHAGSFTARHCASQAQEGLGSWPQNPGQHAVAIVERFGVRVA